MISLESTLISDDLKEVFFCCDLPKCKGACCVEGDGGAPLEEEEAALLEDNLDAILPYMVPAGIEEVRRNGVFDYDDKGKFVTPLVRGKECAFVYFEERIARCAIERAFADGRILFAKPVSCHLYPVRITKTAQHHAVNYHKWDICRKALEKGHKEKIRLYQFLEEALIREYGRNWYNRLIRLLR
jgi:hypothetical protein